jgi:hypothetical protein
MEPLSGPVFSCFKARMTDWVPLVEQVLGSSDHDAAAFLRRAEDTPGICQIFGTDLSTNDPGWLRRQIAASAAFDDREKAALAYILDERIRTRS